MKAIMDASSITQADLLKALPKMNQGRLSLLMNGKVVTPFQSEIKLLERFFFPLKIQDLLKGDNSDGRI